MVKKKISERQKEYSKNIPKTQIKGKAVLELIDSRERLLDKELLYKALIECLENNDPDGVIEIINIYLKTLNKVHLAQQADISRSTLYHSLKTKNPTLKTLARILHSASADLKH